MLHRQKTYIVGDRVVVNKQQGSIKYIGELISSNEIWLGVQLHFTKKNIRKKLLQESSAHQEAKPPKQPQNIDENFKDKLTNGRIDNITYIPNKYKKNITFIKASDITKWFRGVDNKHLSRTFSINQQVWVKSIKCKGTVKSMFYEAPEYILKQIVEKKGKQYLGILLNKPFGNNVNNKIKYFQCEDNYDYFVKVDSKQLIPLHEYKERLSSYNLELIIDFWFRKYFHQVQLAQELIHLLISFFGAMDGTLKLKEHEVYKYSEYCLNFDDFYEYDTVYLGKSSRLIGGNLICIKCFGDLVMDEYAEISVSATVNLTMDELEKRETAIGKAKDCSSEISSSNLKFGAKGDRKGGKGGGIIKIVCFGNVILQKNALIAANGENGNLRAGYGGGGTVYIKCVGKLINHGRIFAMGCSYTEPFYDWVTGNWRWKYWNIGNGSNGQIIIDGEYNEDGSDAISNVYCGPILMPPQTHLNHQSLNIR